MKTQFKLIKKSPHPFDVDIKTPVNILVEIDRRGIEVPNGIVIVVNSEDDLKRFQSGDQFSEDDLVALTTEKKKLKHLRAGDKVLFGKSLCYEGEIANIKPDSDITEMDVLSLIKCRNLLASSGFGGKVIPTVATVKRGDVMPKSWQTCKIFKQADSFTLDELKEAYLEGETNGSMAAKNPDSDGSALKRWQDYKLKVMNQKNESIS